MSTPKSEPEDASEELLTWVGKSSLLPRISTICFILVVALILRTVTDNDLLDKQVGSLLGMIYAAALVSFAAYKYAHRSPLSPIFAIFGAVLMFTIVLETHARFEALPAVPAYLILMITGAGIAFISYRHKVSVPVMVGTLGMSIAGVAIDFPNPAFPLLALLLLSANFLGFIATILQKCSWLRWMLLAITLAMLQVWVIKLTGILHKGLSGDSMALGWFFPTLLFFAAAFLTITLAAILRRGSQKLSKFDFFLPTIFFAWAFAASHQVLAAGRGKEIILGLIAVLTAAILLGIGFWLARRNVDDISGTSSFILAGSVLLAIALPAAAGNMLPALPLISLAAFGLAITSEKWHNGGVRVISYLLQLYACAILVQSLRSMPPSPAIGMMAAAGVAAASFLHFRWCRMHPPAPEMAVFSRLDEEDRSAVLLFMASLGSGFFLFRVAMHQVLVLVQHRLSSFAHAFSCSQSVLINVSAMALMLFAYSRRNKEVRNVAILVTIIGAVKVFIYDLMGTHGFPLVVSVFSFGVAAALESVTLTRWQRIETGEKREQREHELSEDMVQE